MTDFEILKNYRHRVFSPNKQVKILCELNPDRTRSDIVALLHLNGYALEVKQRRSKRAYSGGWGHKVSDEGWRIAIEMKINGASNAEVAMRCGMQPDTVRNWRYKADKLGIKIPEKVSEKK